MSVIGPIVEYTEKQLLGFDGVKVSWVRRSTNKGPHILAREGASFELDRFWLQEQPDCILHIISDEIPSMG